MTDKPNRRLMSWALILVYGYYVIRMTEQGQGEKVDGLVMAVTMIPLCFYIFVRGVQNVSESGVGKWLVAKLGV